MKILITGNPNYGLAQAVGQLIQVDYASRANGFDLSTPDGRAALAAHSTNYDIFINSSALHEFAQTTLLYKVWDKWSEVGHRGRIINIGSTIDTSRRGRAWMYSVEKKALMEASLELGPLGVWGGNGILTSYLSFGSLATPKVAAKHPTRTLMGLEEAAGFVKTITDLPLTTSINILHVDPVQQNVQP